MLVATATVEVVMTAPILALMDEHTRGSGGIGLLPCSDTSGLIGVNDGGGQKPRRAEGWGAQ